MINLEALISFLLLFLSLLSGQNINLNLNNQAYKPGIDEQGTVEGEQATIDKNLIETLLKIQNQLNQAGIQNQNQNQNQNQSQNNNFGPAGGSNIYYIRVNLEGIEQERANNVPSQRLDGNLYCNDSYRRGINARNVISFETTQISVPLDCENPGVLLNISHYLSIYVYLNSTLRSNPQDVYFKAGDVNRDNIIDDGDLLSVQFNFNRSSTSNPQERPDVNLDGIVNDPDLNLVLRNFGARGSRGPVNYSLKVTSQDLNNNNNVPPHPLSLAVTCNDGRLINVNYPNYNLGSLINLETLPRDCNQAQAIVSISYFLTKRVYLSENSETSLNLVYGDTNRDNVIDDNDLLKILFSFGQNSTNNADPRVDLNFDGRVGDEDQAIVLRNFGQRGER
jgi:hypothetical protein